MQQIMVSDILGRPTLLEQDLSEHRLRAGDIVEDLSCMFSPCLYVVVGFTRDLKGNPELLWCTKPSFLISNSNGGGFEVRVRPVIGHSVGINYSLRNSSFSWLEVVERHPKSPCLDRREYLSSCLKVLKFQYSLFQ